MEAMLRQMLQKKKKRPFPTSLKSFATTLHFYSPKAYDYVRITFLYCLLYPSTIRQWYQPVGGSPGICSEAILTLREKVQRAKKKNK